MSRPLIMSFRPDACALCLDGRKRRTRRIRKPEWHIVPDGEIDELVDAWTGRVLWRVGSPITIKPSRTAKGAGRVMCTGLRCERVQDITEEEARLEGVDPIMPVHSGIQLGPLPHWIGFRAVWRSLYPSGPRSWDANPEVVVIEFEPMQAVALPDGGIAWMPVSAEEVPR